MLLADVEEEAKLLLRPPLARKGKGEGEDEDVATPVMELLLARCSYEEAREAAGW
jgi:hypothetical protein